MKIFNSGSMIGNVLFMWYDQPFHFIFCKRLFWDFTTARYFVSPVWLAIKARKAVRPSLRREKDLMVDSTEVPATALAIKLNTV